MFEMGEKLELSEYILWARASWMMIIGKAVTKRNAEHNFFMVRRWVIAVRTVLYICVHREIGYLRFWLCVNKVKFLFIEITFVYGQSLAKWIRFVTTWMRIFVSYARIAVPASNLAHLKIRFERFNSICIFLN